MKKNRVVLFVSFLLVLGAWPLFAQSNALIDELLAEKTASFGKAAYLALAAAQLVPEDASIEQTLAVLQEKGWKIRPRGAEEPIKLGEYSLLLMKGFNLQGGLMYRLAHGPRYAARELAYLKLLPGKPDPTRSLSGEEAVRILSSLLNWKEGKS